MKLEVSEAKRGRKPKNLITRDGRTIDGLNRRTDGRYRIISSGKLFSAPDERTAIQMFRQFSGVSESDSLNEEAMIQWVRDTLLTRSEWLAEKTGIPQLSRITEETIPPQSVSFVRLWKSYVSSRANHPRTIVRAKKMIEEFKETANVSTLKDCTTPVFLGYRDHVRAKYGTGVAAQHRLMRVKTVIRSGLLDGLDADEINAALARAAILRIPKDKGKKLEPLPIERADFHKLLGSPKYMRDSVPFMHALMWTGLNLALHISECADLKWNDLNLDRGTYCCKRGKTSIIRAATLWPETVDALALLRKSHPCPENGYVFHSGHGTRFNTNTLTNKFAKWRRWNEVDASVKFDSLRDGAYTAAIAAGVSFPLCQLLAGHRLSGETDAYVARNPGIVRPACDAVRVAYVLPQKIMKIG